MTSPPATTQTQPDLHEGEKRFGWKLAQVAALAALVGALIGGGATVTASYIQSRSDSTRSVEEFRRDALGDKYQQLLDKVRENFQSISTKRNCNSSTSTTPCPEAIDQHDARRSELYDLSDSVALLSSMEVRRAIAQCQDALLVADAAAMELIPHPGLMVVDRDPEDRDYDTVYDLASTECDPNLKAAIREDLGLG